ncbi:MAG: LysM peptidoglycan-binding domain-containing protein [Methylococcaceae bacterium]|nr:LysM peptidoglycan-binding domain-containing protein [Methylococcaceae bacterium]
MNVKFNRSLNYFLAFMAILAAGCSDTSKAPLSSDNQPPVVSSKSRFYVRHAHAKPRLNFNKAKTKTLTANSHAKTVWERLLSLYALPDIDNERVDRELNWYLDHPGYIARIQQRAEPYLHMILDEVEAKNIPGELALLPVVESAFIPEAYSKSDASGLWQFIPATGRLFGLQQNSWYDGRRDVYASTKAATTFLKELGETFDGDWFLALAAYNYGKGNVRKAIDRNEDLDLPTNYWSLDLPKETSDYVPRLLAVAKLFANAEEYNIPLQYIPNKPYLEAIDIKAPLDLSKAAEMANTPLAHFLKLNPGFNRSCTAPDGPHRLLIPVNQVQAFKSNLAQLPFEDRVDLSRLNEKLRAQTHREPEKTAELRSSPPRIATRPYKVKPGETLASIASRTHTTISSIRHANHLPGTTIRSNMLINIPSQKPVAPVMTAETSKSKSSNSQFYTVKAGDTFWKIAQRFSVSSKNIAEWNKISLKTALVPGRKLTIRAISPQLASTSPIRLIHYNVNKGDTLMQISRRFNVPVTELRKSNADTLVKGLQPGQKLKILIANNQPST